VGRNIQEIERTCWLGGQIFIAKNRKELDERVLLWKPKNTSLEDFQKNNLIGIPDECRQIIRQYTSLGVTYFMLFFGDMPNLSGLRLFAETVVKPMKSNS
jgi:hypothetical protein